MKPDFLMIKRFTPIVFWLVFLGTMILTMMPSHSLPISIKFWDKAEHAFAFFIMMLSGAIAYSKQVKSIFISLILYGALIEIMQANFTRTRNGDINDVIADIVGITIGWLAFLIIYRLTHQK